MALEGVTTTAGSCTFPHPFNFKTATWHVSAVHSAAAGDEMHERGPSPYPLSDADARAANNVMHEVVPVVQSCFLPREREQMPEGSSCEYQSGSGLLGRNCIYRYVHA